jgi:hypothetical protein
MHKHGGPMGGTLRRSTQGGCTTLILYKHLVVGGFQSQVPNIPCVTAAGPTSRGQPIRPQTSDSVTLNFLPPFFMHSCLTIALTFSKPPYMLQLQRQDMAQASVICSTYASTVSASRRDGGPLITRSTGAACCGSCRGSLSGRWTSTDTKACVGVLVPEGSFWAFSLWGFG